MQGPVSSISSIPMPLPPLICFSHLRWDFVTQRPQHLMRRFAAERRVFFWEEPIGCDHPLPYLEYHPFADDGVIALRPRVPHWWAREEVETALRGLLDMLIATSLPNAVTEPPVLWFYTPMMLGFARHVAACTVVYDCMDELSAFAFADPLLVEREAELIARADVMFTGGYSLYEAKRASHDAIRPFPSAVDVAHFATARRVLATPADQAAIAAPRLGFYGVIDERIDLALVDAIAAARPDWQIVMIGPVVKIDHALLPRRANIHWLGGRDYKALPAYLSGWSVALMPFAINAATRFISPTKTPEYLAAGKPVVSTPIVDVRRHYGDIAGVQIADGVPAFIAACEAALALAPEGVWRDEADELLAATSWDRTFAGMKRMMDAPSDTCRSSITAPAVAPAIRPASRRAHYDALVVGAGFAGSVIAERLAAGSDKRVLVIDKRPHVAGNAYDHADAAGIMVHRYGPHIFHTNSDDVFAYLSRFTRWRPYEHRVLASARGKLVPMPINRTTLNALFGLDLCDERQAAAFLAARAEPREVRTSEDVVVNAIGRELYQTFFQGYTRKQWGLDPSELDKSVTARVPTRTDTDDRYFLDKHQAMPAAGYTAMFEAMLDHPNITVCTGVDMADCDARAEHTVYTGPIDAYFDHRFGPLPYRCLEFRHETHDVERFQPAAVVNYPAVEVPYTRITEYRQLTGQASPAGGPPRTSISYEYPCAQGDPYYPIPRSENQDLYRRYEALANGLPDVSFIGRLATYRYYNMDQVVGQALATYRRLAPRLEHATAAA